MNHLMATIYNNFVFPLALKYHLPIIDLSRSFDIHNSDLYEC